MYEKLPLTCHLLRRNLKESKCLQAFTFSSNRADMFAAVKRAAVGQKTAAQFPATTGIPKQLHCPPSFLINGQFGKE